MTERIVEDYLAAVARACAGLPASARVELMADLREHIAVARAELTEQTEAAVGAILQRLGEPATIAAEARASIPPVAVGVAPGPIPMRRSSNAPVAILAAVILVPIGIVALILVVGFFAYYSRS
jgi:uncharacterized membrane protein